MHGARHSNASNRGPAAASGVAKLDRRDFLAAAGFTFGVVLSGCSRAPVENAIAHLRQPPELTPGRIYEYASSCGACPAGCGLRVRCRDGRPVKLEGAPEHPLSRGGLCGPGQASILGLYDSHRIQSPLRREHAATWDVVDAELRAGFEQVRRGDGALRLLTGTIHSPTERAAIRKLLAGFADARHIEIDSTSCAAILVAHERTHGRRVLPRYRFDAADVVVSFDADFLSTWISPVEHTAGYQAARRPEAGSGRAAYHAHIEARMSLTGANADERLPLPPSLMGAAVAALAARVASRAGAAFAAAPAVPSEEIAASLDLLADRLWDARGRALVVSGSQDSDVQSLVNFVNQLLDGYGRTLDIESPSQQRRGEDAAVRDLLAEITGDRPPVLIVRGVDLLHDLPSGETLRDRLAALPMFVYVGERLDETAEQAHLVCPEPHFLASWGDGEPVRGLYTLQQPAMHPLEDARPFLESLAAWAGEPAAAYDQIRAVWREAAGSLEDDEEFEALWRDALQAGFAAFAPADEEVPGFSAAGTRPASAEPEPGDDVLELILYAATNVPSSSHAYNAWLQEAPDPLSKIAWDNCLSLSPGTAAKLGLEVGDVVRLAPVDSAENATIEVPVWAQPGQHDRAAALALGYGAKTTERFAAVGPSWIEARPSVGANGRVGVNAAPLLSWRGAGLRYAGRPVRVEATGRSVPLAATQEHHTIETPAELSPRGAERRDLVREVSWERHRKDLAAGAVSDSRNRPSLWADDFSHDGPRWGMIIDLDACTGCNACTISCQAENNIPVVGKDEVRRSREMHWMRIDRYFSGEGGRTRTLFQPMLCQHCAHAPCETVCPVLATVHSEEGLNQQVYNRCVGTRYCANNCPFKVRRFNWFDYAHDDPVENLALNPDVTVRSRGVMEKCSLCVQRIQEAKIEATRRGEPLRDGDAQTACQQSCPANAIRFGDLNDPDSGVARAARNPRRYRLLEEMNFETSISYLAVLRRTEPDTGEGQRDG